MAIIVDKEKKRRDIAIACTDLLLEKGLKKLTVSEIAKTAGIGKGTVYEYFPNKEAVVFEIIRNVIEEHQQNLIERSDENTSCRQKVFYLFDFSLCQYKDYTKHLDVYREYLSVTLAENNLADMNKFNRECSSFFKNILTKIIEDGIDKGELIGESINLTDGLMAADKGLLLKSWSEDSDYKPQLTLFINTLFNLIEIKK